MALELVKDADNPPAKPPAARRTRRHRTIAAAVESSHRDTLAALRRNLAQAMDKGTVSANALASVSKRIEELDAAIRRIDEAAEEVARRAAAEEAAADAPFDPEAL